MIEEHDRTIGVLCHEVKNLLNLFAWSHNLDERLAVEQGRSGDLVALIVDPDRLFLNVAGLVGRGCGLDRSVGSIVAADDFDRE
jgi:hypothetical protein